MKPAHIKAHRQIWFALAILLPLGFVLAMVGKYMAPTDAPAIQLEPPKQG